MKYCSYRATSSVLDKFYNQVLLYLYPLNFNDMLNFNEVVKYLKILNHGGSDKELDI